MNVKREKIIVLVGPTCVGKTSIAIELSKKLNAEIVSADSRQVVKKMDLGTGKIPSDSFLEKKKDGSYEADSVKIWGYDLIDPDRNFSAFEFARFAINKISEILKSGKNVLLVGGTGFYVDVITGRLKLDNAGFDPELRNELNAQSLDILNQKLESTNPDAYKKIDKKNKARVIRQIEKDSSSRSSVEQISIPENWEFFYIGLTGPRELLYKRADVWLENTWQEIAEETRKLIKLGFGDTPRLNALIYKSAQAQISGVLSESDALQRAKFDTHAYIRRQQTWFKKNKNIKWFDISELDLLEDILSIL